MTPDRPIEQAKMVKSISAVRFPKYRPDSNVNIGADVSPLEDLIREEEEEDSGVTRCVCDEAGLHLKLEYPTTISLIAQLRRG